MVLESIKTDDDFYKCLEKIQKEHFIINLNGKVFVLNEDEELGLILTDVQDFKVYHKHLHISTPIINTTRYLTKYVADEFFKSCETKRLNGFIFDPKKSNGVVGNYYNIWKGFKYQPREGNVHPFLTLLNVNCNEDVDAFEYFLNYCALAIQKPWSNPRTAIAIIGNQGSGKGTLINDSILKLTDNSKHLESIDQLIGNFNGHLKDAFFICLDEATFGGDIKESNKLKTFISESQRTINDKYKSQYSISCYSKLFILSNNDYIVNVEQSDRRYMVLRANDKLKGNFKWFDNYQKWLRNGGYEAIMFYLLNRDISNFNPLDIPKTQEKTDLQLKSSDMPTKFLYDILAGNVTFRESMIVGNKIYRTELYEEFVDYCRRYSSKGYIQTTTEFNKVVVKAFDFQKPNWRQNWKDKKGYYYEMDSLFDFQEKFALNLFKTKAEDLFFNLKQNNEETTQQEIDSVFYKDEQK